MRGGGAIMRGGGAIKKGGGLEKQRTGDSNGIRQLRNKAATNKAKGKNRDRLK